MEIKNIGDISSELLALYKRATEAIKKNNIEYAIDLLKLVVLREPAFLQARQDLRSIERQKGASGFLKRTFNSLKITKLVNMGQLALLRKKYSEALQNVEDALAIDIKNLSALDLLAAVGKAMDAKFMVLEAYETAVSFYPNNGNVLKKLALAYRLNDRHTEEIGLWNKIITLAPGDANAKAELRDASALFSMEEQGWKDTDTSYRDKIKDVNKSVDLEQQERIVRNTSDVKDLIQSLENQLKTEKEPLKIIKQLADLYQQVGEHERAIEYLKKINNLTNSIDLIIDKKIEESEIALVNLEIKQLEQTIKDNPEKEKELREKIAKKQEEIQAIKEILAINRIKLFPNDLELRYELALICFEIGKIDSAIEQFQFAQNNPHRQLLATAYLGQCFMLKKQYDIAVEQFLKVLNKIGENSKEAIDLLYYLAATYEKMNDKENAAKYYKKVYTINSKYKDISQKILEYYK